MKFHFDIQDENWMCQNLNEIFRHIDKLCLLRNVFECSLRLWGVFLRNLLWSNRNVICVSAQADYMKRIVVIIMEFNAESLFSCKLNERY